MQPSQNDVRAEPHGNRTMIDLVHNEDPFASDQDEGGLFVDRPVRNTNEPERENSQDGFTHPEHGEWDGLDWDGKEEEILSRAIYRNKYELVSMAERLNRTPYDVWRKASWFKKLFRDNYRDKGEQIPNWWW
ncbi:hypothetical protein M406DRAFT_323887 [Cryphonectria parasitica EP155]|uniref:Uncharacterized protein n=1 Tax=Cryphonectria parasitica (strain ATCC 38755 / EP155) TaxID=660469 RepID=A0A9P5CKZ3_CRYP1|nr:uncharacterized protein M406DRAFT_323887 [Cryphonectria parasitica EP155]KAF3761481.1 hypothetical protein M406DRAFT_323887 [Cryphonectria parasitica EP155]